MESQDVRALLEGNNQEITFEERAARLRMQAREEARDSVQRIRSEGAERVRRLEEAQAREFALIAENERRATRGMVSGFSIAFLVGAAAVLASLFEAPSLLPDLALEGSREYEVLGPLVAVTGAEAELEGASEPESKAPVVSPAMPRRSQPMARPVPRPASSRPIDPCTGNAYDPLNFCL